MTNIETRIQPAFQRRFRFRASGFFRHSSFVIVISIMGVVNETLIRDVVIEVMERLNGSPAPVKFAPAPAAPPSSSAILRL